MTGPPPSLCPTAQGSGAVEADTASRLCTRGLYHQLVKDRRYDQADRAEYEQGSAEPRRRRVEALGSASDPAHQGTGIGTALLEPVLATCDRDGVPAYLESSKEANVPYYERFGWKVTAKASIDTSYGFLDGRDESSNVSLVTTRT